MATLISAICVGSGTILADNPSLTARLPEETFVQSVWSWIAGCQLLISRSRRVLFTPINFFKTKVITTSVGLNNKDAVKRADESGISLIGAKKDENGPIDLSDLPLILEDLDLIALYCEGGAKIANSLLDHNLCELFVSLSITQTIFEPGCFTWACFG